MRRLEAPAVEDRARPGQPGDGAHRRCRRASGRSRPWLRWSDPLRHRLRRLRRRSAAARLWSVQSGWLARELAVVGDVALTATADARASACRPSKCVAAARPARPDVLGAIGARARRAAARPRHRRDARAAEPPCPGSSRRRSSGAIPTGWLVTVTEAEPMALWQRKQKLFLVSRAGKVIETADLAQIFQAAGDRGRQRAGARREPCSTCWRSEPKLKDRVDRRRVRRQAALEPALRQRRRREAAGRESGCRPGRASPTCRTSTASWKRTCASSICACPTRWCCAGRIPPSPKTKTRPAGDKPKDKAT